MPPSLLVQNARVLTVNSAEPRAIAEVTIACTICEGRVIFETDGPP